MQFHQWRRNERVKKAVLEKGGSEGEREREREGGGGGGGGREGGKERERGGGEGGEYMVNGLMV